MVVGGDGQADRLMLVFAHGNICAVELVICLQVHPHISRDAKGFFECNSYVERDVAFAVDCLAEDRLLNARQL